MVDAAAQHSTDIGRGEIVYLAQLEDLPILCGKSSQTLTERVGRFTRRHEPVRWNWRLPPRSIAIESRFERLVELIQRLFSRMRPPPLVRLAITESRTTRCPLPTGPQIARSSARRSRRPPAPDPRHRPEKNPSPWRLDTGVARVDRRPVGGRPDPVRAEPPGLCVLETAQAYRRVFCLFPCIGLMGLRKPFTT